MKDLIEQIAVEARHSEFVDEKKWSVSKTYHFRI